MITIKVNDKLQHLPENSSLLEALDHLKIETSGIAVAINQQIVGRDLWASTALKENDTLLIITATQGG